MLFGIRRWLCFVLVLFAGLSPVNGQAQSIHSAPMQPAPMQPATLRPTAVCHADAARDESWSAVSSEASRWRCDDRGWTLAENVLVRFDLGGKAAGALPRSLVTHTGNFERIDIGVVGPDGRTSWTFTYPSQARHIAAGPYLVIPLGNVTAQTQAIAVRVVKPWTKTLMSEMRLDSSPEGSGWPLPRIIAMAAICGMLLVPLLINTAFYAVLPERYVIWHLVMVAAMLVQTAFATGFIHVFVEVSALWEWQVSNIAFSAMAAAALLFAASFIEEEALPARLRSAARSLAPAMIGAGVIACIPFDGIRPYSSALMQASIGLAIVVLATMLWEARRRDSRSVRLQIVAWTPLLVVASWRICSLALPGLRPTDAIEIYQLALALEVLVTAFGIVQRFVDVRQERDLATARAVELEGVADRDPLTGLRNRRTIERKFAHLFERGFRTMAVLDLDLFKAINDTHGHATGDVVLRATASALPEDRDTKAIRMGGEEFLLLLRGSDAAARAERYRRAISTRIAEEVPGLDRIVTASMGLVDLDPRGNLQIDFASLYARCDKLLYEAKRLGRNRTLCEKVTGFAAHGRAIA